LDQWDDNFLEVEGLWIEIEAEDLWIEKIDKKDFEVVDL
jgi:hypothetical protein